jgi:hypothetical protein
MIAPAPDRIEVFHTAAYSVTTQGGPTSEWVHTGTSYLRARISTLSDSAALTANAEGRYLPRVTHRMRCDVHEDVVVNALVRRHSDLKVWRVQAVRESNARHNGRADHLICDLSVEEPAPEVDTTRYR